MPRHSCAHPKFREVRLFERVNVPDESVNKHGRSPILQLVDLCGAEHEWRRNLNAEFRARSKVTKHGVRFFNCKHVREREAKVHLSEDREFVGRCLTKIP